MKVEIEIRDKLHKEIKAVCDSNSMDIGEYLSKLIEDGYYLDKYGDLNNVFNKKATEEEKKEEVKAEETPPESQDATVWEENQSDGDETKEEPKTEEIKTAKRTKRTLKSR